LHLDQTRVDAGAGRSDVSKRIAKHADVQRILRDVLDSHGFHHVSGLRVERVSTGWHVVISDASDRVMSSDVADGSPAEIRAALTRWILSQ
jgi:hypothetical protein